jgi:hypothetical protein
METTIAPIAKPKRKYEKSFNKAFKRAVAFLESKGAKPLFYGCHRAAMIRGNVIYKLPRHSDGIEANFEEDYFFNKMCKHKEFALRQNRNDDTGRILGFARCKLIWIKKIPVLMMERLTPLHREDFRLTADMKTLDGGQFGETKRGDFLCFDYSRILRWNLPSYPDALKHKVNTYYETFRKTYKKDTWAEMANFEMCCGAPSLDHVKTIRES